MTRPPGEALINPGGILQQPGRGFNGHVDVDYHDDDKAKASVPWRVISEYVSGNIGTLVPPSKDNSPQNRVLNFRAIFG